MKRLVRAGRYNPTLSAVWKAACEAAEDRDFGRTGLTPIPSHVQIRPVAPGVSGRPGATTKGNDYAVDRS